MKGLPEEFDPQIFVDRIVEQICVNANQISIQFGDRLILTIEGAFCLTVAASAASASDSTPLRLEAPTFVPEILALIEQKVMSAQAMQNGTLTIQFERGDVLQVLVDSSFYESYRIYHRDQEIIV